MSLPAAASLLTGPLARRLYGAALVAAAVCLAYLAVSLVHFRYFEVRVVLYAGLFDALLAAGLVGIGLAALARLRATPFLGLVGIEPALAWTAGLLASLFFVVLIPTVVDRSLSIYLLEKLDQRGGAIAADRLETIFVDEYLPEHHVVGVRLTEQLNSGTIRLENGCVRLTSQGKRAVWFAQTFRGAFLPRHRRILGDVTAAMTHPVGQVDPGSLPDYGCKGS